MSPTVISSREYSEKLSASKSLKAIHHALMRSENEIRTIILKELVHTVWSKFYNITGAIWVSDNIWLYSFLHVRVCRV